MNRGCPPNLIALLLAFTATLFACSTLKSPGGPATATALPNAPSAPSAVVTGKDRPEHAKTKVPVSAADPQWGDVDAPVLDATGLVVAPGFVNVLSHAWGTLQLDPTGASDLLQGVTTEVFGEAFSLGPSDERTVEAMRPWGDMGRDVEVVFPRLSNGLDHLERRGVASREDAGGSRWRSTAS